jgi:hypothetical protein
MRISVRLLTYSDICASGSSKLALTNQSVRKKRANRADGMRLAKARSVPTPRETDRGTCSNGRVTRDRAQGLILHLVFPLCARWFLLVLAHGPRSVFHVKQSVVLLAPIQGPRSVFHVKQSAGLPVSSKAHVS